MIVKTGRRVANEKIRCWGFAFKKNSADPRNNLVIDLVVELQKLSPSVEVYEPLVGVVEAPSVFCIDVPARFLPLGAALTRDMVNGSGVLCDIKRSRPVRDVGAYLK